MTEKIRHRVSGFSVFRLKIDTLPTEKVYRVVQVFLSIIKIGLDRTE